MLYIHSDASTVMWPQTTQGHGQQQPSLSVVTTVWGVTSSMTNGTANMTHDPSNPGIPTTNTVNSVGHPYLSTSANPKPYTQQGKLTFVLFLFVKVLEQEAVCSLAVASKKKKTFARLLEKINFSFLKLTSGQQSSPHPLKLRIIYSWCLLKIFRFYCIFLKSKHHNHNILMLTSISCVAFLRKLHGKTGKQTSSRDTLCSTVPPTAKQLPSCWSHTYCPSRKQPLLFAAEFSST